MCASIKETAKCRRLPTAKAPMATRAVNKTAKEGEQNARLLLSRGALSAMAIFRRLHSRVFGDGAAPRRTCCSPQPRQHSVFRASGGGVLQVLPSVPFFFAGRAAVIWCGANPGVRPWQDLRECALGRLAVAIFSRDAFSGVLPMAKCSRNAFPSVRRRQDCALMRSWPDWQWQYSRAMRSRVSIRGNIPPRCVPGRPSVTIFSPHASQKRPRTGKSPVRGKIRAPCIRKRAPFGKICAPCIRKAPQTAFRERTA